LAFVLKNHASDLLLDTYQDERAPIAKRNIEWSTTNAKRFFDIFKAIQTGDDELLKIKLEEQQKNLNYEGLDLGFIYHSKAVQSENDQVMSVLPDQYIPTTLPGSRAPYLKLMKDGKYFSILDLFNKEYILLVASQGQKWQESLKEWGSLFPIKCYRIASDGDFSDPTNHWHTIYEITENGAVLVRPDGHVAWRSKDMVDDPKSVFSHIFQTL
jgi:hypothetical protein